MFIVMVHCGENGKNMALWYVAAQYDLLSLVNLLQFMHISQCL